MNRIIKFKVWDYLNQSFYDKGRGFDIKDNDFGGWGDEVTYCQFTGLIDKNNKEIYEGDIIYYKYTCGFGHCVDKGVVEYNAPKFKLNGYRDSKLGQKVLLDLWMESLGRSEYDLEIVGNVFENPELFK